MLDIMRIPSFVMSFSYQIGLALIVTVSYVTFTFVTCHLVIPFLTSTSHCLFQSLITSVIARLFRLNMYGSLLQAPPYSMSLLCPIMFPRPSSHSGVVTHSVPSSSIPSLVHAGRLRAWRPHRCPVVFRPLRSVTQHSF